MVVICSGPMEPLWRCHLKGNCSLIRRNKTGLAHAAVASSHCSTTVRQVACVVFLLWIGAWAGLCVWLQSTSYGPWEHCRGSRHDRQKWFASMKFEQSLETRAEKPEEFVVRCKEQNPVPGEASTDTLRAGIKQLDIHKGAGTVPCPCCREHTLWKACAW